ncbi:MAG TPA: hypothetical protein VF525_14095 [Pyrinomonadaceae bacterium]|jgi:hypothetical protein
MKVEEYLPNFVGLSAIMTGYDANVLAPKIDPLEDNSIAQQYLRLMLAKADNELFLAVLSLFGNIRAAFPLAQQDPWSWTADTAQQVSQQVEAQIMIDDDMASMLRRLVRLWYLATWYTNEPPDGDGQVVSEEAYKQGLAWPTFQAHPMGYSELDFGYWASLPPTAATTPPAPPILNTQSATPPATESGGKQRGGV